MSLEEKINFIEGENNQVSSVPPKDPFHHLTGQAPNTIQETNDPEHTVTVPTNINPTLEVPSTPHHNYVPGIEDYVEAMDIDQFFPDKYIPQVDPGLKEIIDNAAQFANHLTQDLDNRTPYDQIGPASSTYNPLSEITGRPDYNTTQGRNQATMQAFQQATLNSPEVKNPGFIDPFGFSVRGQNMDRYIFHPKYDKLGFNVFADNESYYNKNSGWGHDMQRTMGQFAQIYGTAFTGAFRSIGDIFTGDWSMSDKKSANIMENSMRIAASTRGGMGGFVNDFVLNSAYTFGMLSSIIAEEAIFALMTLGGGALAAGGTAAAPFSGGASLPAAAAGGGLMATGLAGMLRGLSKIPQAFSISKRLKAVREMISSVSKLPNAKKWYEAAKLGKRGAHGLANFLAPETLYALKNLKHAKSAGQNILNLAHSARTFGAFYRDIRMINLALSESKLESGMVESQTFDTLYQEFLEREGRAPTEQEMGLIKHNSSRAGWRTLQANFPVIFLSNKIVLDGWLKGPKPIQRLIDEHRAGIGKTVYDTGRRKGMKGFKKGDRYKQMTEQGSWWDVSTMWKRMKERGAAGNVKYLGIGAMRATPPMFVEGMQEVYQESIAHATETYFGDIYAEDIRTGVDLLQLNLGKENWDKDFWESTKKGFASQFFTPEGGKVFASGFFMGALMGPSSNFFFQTIPNLYRSKSDPINYQKYLDQKKTLATKYTNLLNEAYENPLEFFDPDKLNSASQKQITRRIAQASLEGDMLDLFDAQQDALFSQLNMLYETGRLGAMEDAMDDYLAMDDETLSEAFSESEYIQEGKPEKLRKKLKEAKDKAKEIKQNQDRFRKMFPGKARPQDYKEGSQEWIQQVILQQMENHARNLLVYNKSEMMDAAKRMEEIMDWAVKQGPLANMDSQTLMVLQGKNKMKEEMQRLKDFVALNAMTPEAKKAKANAKKKLKALEKLNDVLFAPENQVAKVNATKDYVTPQGKKIYKLDENGNRIPVVVDGVVQKDRKGDIVYEMLQVAKDPHARSVGGYNKSPQYISKLRKPFIDYLKTVAEIEGKTLEVDKVDDMLKKIVDYGYLNNRIGDYSAALDILMDQNFFYDTAGRLAYNANRMWKKYKNSHHRRIKAYIEKHGERVAFLKSLAAYKGPGGAIFADPEEVERFLSKDEITLADIPSTFYQEDGMVIPGKAHPDTIAEIQRLIEVQARLIKGEHVQDESNEEIEEDVEHVMNIDEDLVETEEEKQEARENKKTLEEFYEEDSDVGVNTRAILEREHNKYKALSIFEPHTFSFDIWKAHPKLGRKIIEARMKAHQMWLELAEDNKKEYENFDDWLVKNIRKNARLDSEIFTPLKINGYSIINKVVVDQDIMPGIVTPGKDIVLHKDLNKGLFLIKYEGGTAHPTTGKMEYFYKIIDAEGTNAFDKYSGLNLVKSEHPIKSGWTVQSEALKAYENLLISIPEMKTYKFGGMDFTQGETIIDSNGKKYIVASNSTQAGLNGFVYLKPVGEIAKDVTTWKKITDKKDFDDRQFKRFKEDYSKLNLDKGKRYKLNINYPVQFWANPSYGTVTKEEFQDFLRSLSPEGRRNLRIDIKRNPAFDFVVNTPSRDLEPFKMKDGAGGDTFVTNEYIRQGAPKFIVSITNGTGQEIARLQGFHDMVLVDPKTGEKIIPKDMTMEQMEDIFNLTYVGSKFAIKTKQDALEHVKKAYKEGQIIDEIFNEVLADEDAVSINLFDVESLNEQFKGRSNKSKLVQKLEKLSLAMSPGNPAFKTLDDNGRSTKTNAKTNFNDIRYKTFKFKENEKGEFIPVGLDSKDNDEGYFYVMDHEWTISEDEAGTVVERYKSKRPPIHNIDTETPEGVAMLDAIEKKIGEAQEANRGFTVFDDLGRYTLVSILPNGQVTFIELQAVEHGEAEVDKFVTQLKNQQKKSKKNLDENGEPIVKEFNNLFNESIYDNLYITGKPAFAFGSPMPVSLEIWMGQYGNVMFEYLEMPGTKQERGGKIALTPEEMKDVNNAKDLISKIKDKFAKEHSEFTFDLDVSSFRKSIPKQASPEDMQTTKGTIRPEVRTGIGLTLTVNDSDFFQMHSNTEVDGKDTIENKQKEQDQVNKDEVDTRIIDNNFIKEYDPSMGGKGWDEVPTAILQNLTNKLGDPDGVAGLTQLEKVVIDETDLIKRIENGEFKKDIKTLDIKDKEQQIKLKKQQIKSYTKEALSVIKKELDNLVSEGKMGKPERNITYLQRKMSFLDSDPGLIALEEELADIESTRAYKITDNFDGNDVEDINVFINWAKNNLPEFIGIEDINTLQERLNNKGITLGMFMMELQKVSGGLKFLGKIYTSPTSGYRYHEAFHSVFRMLLTDQEISTYLDIAKKQVRKKLRKEGKNLKSELAAMRLESPIYNNLSEEMLEERYYEEYLADRFQEFKQNPKTKTVPKGLRGFFNKIIEWIKSVFERFSSNYTLNKLFKDIDSGKYRNLNVQDNRFTNAITSGVTEPVFKIKIGTTTVYKNVDVNGKLEAGEVEQNIYLSPSETNKLRNSIGGLYLRRLRDIKGEYIPAALLKDTINDYVQMYNPARPFYINEENGIPYDEVEEELFEKFEILNNKEVQKEIAKEVNDWLSLFDMKMELEEDQMAYNIVLEDSESSENIPSVGDWDMQTNQMGGFRNLPQALRAFIGMTTLEAKDQFGNEYIPKIEYDGNGMIIKDSLSEKHVESVDYITAYNGLLKAVAGSTTPMETLQGLVSFSQTSVHTKAVIERFFREMGIKDYNTLLNENASLPIDQIESANPAQFNQIIKSLSQFSVDYMFIEKNTKTGKTLGHVDVYAANHKDDAHDQINKWNSAYDIIYWKRRNSKSVRSAAVRAVNLLHSELNSSKKSINDSTLLSLSKRLSENIFDTTGIKLSRGYIRFSILKQIKKNAGNQLLSPIQETVLNANKNIEHMTAESVAYWSGLLDSGRDLFANFSAKISTNKSKDKDNSESKVRDGIQSRLKLFARGNAIFDETVGTTVFRDPEGNLIYSHQLPTFHLEAIKELNGGSSTIKKLKSGYNKENNLLQEGSSFGILSQKGEIKPLRISGQKQVVVNVDKNSGDVSVIESDGTPGVTYGDSTPSDMLSSIINTALWNFNSANGVVKTVENKFGKKVAIVPSLIRVMEASNTGDFVSLGSVHSVEYIDQTNKEFKLTDDYINRHINNIQNEYNRIYLETEQVENADRDKIKGYNDVSSLDEARLLDDDPKAARAFKLTNTGDLVTKVIVDKKEVGKRTKYTLDDTIKQELEELARQGIPFEQAMQEVPVNLKDLIIEKLNFEFDQFMEIATELGVLDKISAAFGSSLLTTTGVKNQNIKDSMSAYNFKEGDLKYNLAQIFHSDFINTVDINNLLLGDQAVSLKDSIDKIKRAKAQNAAGPNAQSVVGWPAKNIEAISEIKIITHEDPTHTSQFNLDVSKEEKDPKKAGTQDTMDAQILMTVKGLKHTQFGMGRLTQAQLEVIERIENDEKISWYDWFGDPDKGSQGLKKGKGALNSQKYVYADGQTYLKMSVVPLVREEVSYKKGERWVARKGKEKLHNLLNKMEAEEAKGGIMMSIPETASKMMRKNVLTENEVFETDKPLDSNGPLEKIQARYLRLQQVNPFGKTEIADVRQMKELILSEQIDSTPVVIRGSETTVGKLKTAYQKAAGDRFELGFTTKRNLIVKLKDKNNTDAIYGFLFANEALKNKENIDIDLYSVLQYSINALKASKSKQQMMDFFEVDETGVQKFNLNNPITRQQFEEKFFSFWNDTFAEKQPGTSYTLKSSYGHKVIKKVIALDSVTKQPIRWEVLRNDDYVAMDLRGEAPIIAKENYDNEIDRTFVGLKEGQYYLDDLRHDVMEYDENNKSTGQRYSEFIAPPQFSSAIRFLKEGQSIPDVIAKQFGTRVPSQDKHSSINLKLVDFSPIYLGNSAIFNRELIEISGADFDIDQLYTQFKQFFVEKKVVKSSEQIEQEWEEWTSTLQWSPKSKSNIVRINIRGEFDVTRSKKEFAAAKRRGDLTYNPKRNEAGDLVVQESSTNKQEYGKNNQYRYDENTGEFSDIVEGKVVEYGASGLTIKEEYNQYLRYVIGEAKKPGSLIFLALSKWNNSNGIFDKIEPKDITVHASSQFKFIKDFIEDNGMIYGALQSVGLPTDLKSYKKWKEIHNKGNVKGDFIPNTAALNNQLLDYKFGLLGNKSIAEALPGRDHAIKNEPANLSPLTNSISKEGVLEIVQELVPELKEIMDQGQINVDNLLGKVKVFESNKEGANSIGAAVLPNVVVNVLQMFDVNLIKGEKIDHRLKFNGIIFDSFGDPYIKDNEGKPDIQKRKQYIISAIITAMTDNAKEQLAAKLGLNKDALAIAVNMTALGVPIKTSILLVKNPSIQQAYSLAKNKKKITDPGVEFHVRERLKMLEFLNKKLKGESKISANVTDNSMIRAMRKFYKSGYNNVFNEKYSAELTKKEVREEIQILNEFLKARNIKTYSGKAQSLITLLAGVGRDLSNVEKRLEDFKSLNLIPGDFNFAVPFYMSRIVKNRNNMLGRYFKGYMEFVNLLPSIFITKTTPFESLLSGLYNNLATGSQMTDAKKQKVINDTLSILTLKAYEHQLGLDIKIRPSLSNSMLYKETDGISINNVIEKIKDILGDKENDFINFYVYTNEKQPGVDLLESNTWATLSDIQLQDIQLSFLELFKNENTRDLAYDIIHYAMVKDGLQNRVSSFLKALPADMLDGPINAIARVDDFFKGKVKSTFEDVFGISEAQLTREFDKYFEHISNGTILKTVRSYNPEANKTLKEGGLKKSPIQKNKSGVLGISMLNTIDSLPTKDKEAKTIYIPSLYLGKSIVGKEVQKVLTANALYAKQMGWKVNKKIMEIADDVEVEYYDVTFPKMIVRKETAYKKDGTRYNVEHIYKLDKIFKAGDNPNSNELPSIIDSNEGIGAYYKVMKEGLKGTKDQYGGGVLVSGNVPFSSKIDAKKNKKVKGIMSQGELNSFKEPQSKVFDIGNPNIKEINITNKKINIINVSNENYDLKEYPDAGFNIDIKNHPLMKKKQDIEKSQDNVVKVKKDDVSSWTLRVDPKTGVVTNINTNKKLNPRKDSKLINKAHVLSGYVRYTEVSVKGKKYLVTNDGKVINAIPGSKNQGVAVKKTSALYAEAVKLAAAKKAKEDVEIPSIEEAVNILQRQEEDVTVTKEDMEEKIEATEEVPVEDVQETIEEDVQEEVEEESVQQLDLFGGQYTITPQERKFIDWWNSLTIEQKDNVLDNAFTGVRIESAADLIDIMRDLKIEPTEKVIENLKCYI